MSTVNSRVHVAQQVAGIKAALGDEVFGQLMATVDPVIVGQLEPFVS